MLELRDLCFSVDDEAGAQDILNHISLTVPENSLTVFTGPRISAAAQIQGHQSKGPARHSEPEEAPFEKRCLLLPDSGRPVRQRLSQP